MGGGRQPLSLVRKPIFDKIFAVNCMKMKEIGPGGGFASLVSPWIRQWPVLENSEIYFEFYSTVAELAKPWKTIVADFFNIVIRTLV